MNKLKVMDQVYVYRDVFSDDELKLIVDEILKSGPEINASQYQDNEIDPDQSSYLDKHGPQPENRKDGSLIKTWAPWYTYGVRSLWASPRPSTDPDSNQARGYKLLHEAVIKVHNDYIANHVESGTWTYEIDDWHIGETEEDSMIMSTLEILRHKKNLETQYTVGVHTDWHNHRIDEPGPKQILTYTIYINDDYEGGEVDFIDENNKHLIAYKPRRGDVTVFPSGRPYWHGARAVTSDESKFFIRTFASYRLAPNKRWLDGMRIWGPTVFLDYENDRLKDIVDSGSIGRQLVREGLNPDPNNLNPPLYYNKETYIDGRKE
jgi:hypothetical protein